MICEILILELIILIAVLITNQYSKLKIFKYCSAFVITLILGYFIIQTIALFGFARVWWGVDRSFLVASVPGIAQTSVEEVFLYLLMPFSIIVAWEFFNKSCKDKK